MKMSVSIYQCPVDGCPWELDPGSLPPARVLVGADSLDEALTASARAGAAATEAVLRGHMETHDVFDFLQTIQRLNQDLAQFDSGIRPHIYRERMGAHQVIVRGVDGNPEVATRPGLEMIPRDDRP